MIQWKYRATTGEYIDGIAEYDSKAWAAAEKASGEIIKGFRGRKGA